MAVADWYERRTELESDQVYSHYDGSIMKLDRRVPGDGTQWYAANWCGDHWSYDDSIIEPGDLVERLVTREESNG
jgi:hypothetical protein